jgi:hypothetical protein
MLSTRVPVTPASTSSVVVRALMVFCLVCLAALGFVLSGMHNPASDIWHRLQAGISATRDPGIELGSSERPLALMQQGHQKPAGFKLFEGYTDTFPRVPVVWSRGYYNAFAPPPGVPIEYYNSHNEIHPLSPKPFINASNSCGILWLRQGDVKWWVTEVMPLIQCDVTLVSGDGIADMPSSLGSLLTKKVVNSPRIKAWYAQNLDSPVHLMGSKTFFFHLPLGLNLHIGQGNVLGYRQPRCVLLIGCPRIRDSPPAKHKCLRSCRASGGRRKYSAKFVKYENWCHHTQRALERSSMIQAPFARMLDSLPIDATQLVKQLGKPCRSHHVGVG